MLFTTGTLWQRIVRTTEQALAARAMLPIATEYEFVEDGGVAFFVRLLANLWQKEEARNNERAKGAPGNPFLPPEAALTVAGVTDSHLAVLNKFNVVDHHLLIVTRHFEEQEMLLTPGDFEALIRCMAEYDGLGFYNGGAEAGASQRHKHLQLLPLPLAPSGPAVPLEPLLDRAVYRAGIGSAPDLRFRHALCSLDSGAAADVFERYRALLAALGMRAPEAGAPVRQSAPYCLLVTGRWMLLVPRSREFFGDISFNSLAYAGCLLVRDRKQLDRLREYGPLRALRDTAVAE